MGLSDKLQISNNENLFKHNLLDRLLEGLLIKPILKQDVQSSI